MPKRHSTKSKGRSWWAAQVAAYEKSGLTLKAFSESRGVNASTFGKWRQRLLAETESQKLTVTRSPGAFVEIELPAQPTPLIRVNLGHVTVDFETLPPPAWIAELAARGGSQC